jgi:NAD(P)H-hydrate epimerase
VLSDPPEVTEGVVVDALLGTGLREDLRGEVADRVDWMGGLELPVLAVDMPTGICGRTGRVLGNAVRAEITVTIGRPKMGAFLHPGAEHVGDLVYLDIGLAGPEERVATITDPAWVRDRLPVRLQNSHKGSHGHLGVVAGSPTKAGAAVLVCNGAIRSGCGLVTLLIHPGAMERLSALREEIMVQPCEHITPGDVAPFDALAIGPGFGTDATSQEVLRRLWYEAEAPAVFDADGLTALAGGFRPSPHPRGITPHPGEAGRLLDCSTAEINADRLGALASLSAVAPSLLKGNQSLVSGKPPRINRSGGPQLSTAGSGDVLTGVVGAMLAQGMDPEEALAVGAFVHGRAGERAGASPIVAGDVVDCLGEAIRDPEHGRTVLETRPLLGRIGPIQEVQT